MSKLTQYAGKGTEQVTDTKTAYLKIAQTLSDECIKQKPNYIPGLEAGMFFCPTTKKVFGAEIDVIVLATRKSYLITNDKDEFIGFEDCIQPTWRRDADGRLRTEKGEIAKVQYSYLVVTPDKLDEPMVLIIKKSDIPAARDWNTMIKTTKLEDGSLCPIFGVIYTLSTVFRENDSGSWFSLTTGRATSIKAKGLIPDELVDTVAELYEQQAKAMSLASTQTQALPETTEEKDL